MTSAGRKGVLVVEDDPEIRYLLEAVLGRDDRDVVSAVSGAEAERALEAGSFDLIILDLILPDSDGRTLLTRIRSAPRSANVPVIVISARSGTDVRQDCYAAGADVFVQKPFDPAEVDAQVDARLEIGAGSDPEGLIDDTTGFLNRAGMSRKVASVDEVFGLALVQLDRFASFADRWGWGEAEGAVARIGDALRSALDETSIPGRLGGGELLIVMPGLREREATERAERALDAIRGVDVEDPEGQKVRFTASIGVIEAEPDLELEQAIALARRRLFRARASGRNQVVWSETEEDTSARVLVAEDDEISATILLHRLEKEGLDVVRFDNGRAAYEAALEETPDLVILDIKMPGMDGFEVLERLRRSPAYAAVPIILLTSMGSESDVVRGFDLGADDYILKPFSPVELSARVWRLLRRGRSEFAI